jgi:hypothetical protein
MSSVLHRFFQELASIPAMTTSEVVKKPKVSLNYVLTLFASTPAFCGTLDDTSWKKNKMGECDDLIRNTRRSKI